MGGWGAVAVAGVGAGLVLVLVLVLSLVLALVLVGVLGGLLRRASEDLCYAPRAGVSWLPPAASPPTPVLLRGGGGLHAGHWARYGARLDRRCSRSTKHSDPR